MSFSIGRRVVFLLIRWANDNLVSDVPVITTILVVMGIMSIITYAIGVQHGPRRFRGRHARRPIADSNSAHRRAAARPLAALFMPVFFGLAGLNADLGILREPSLLLLSLGRIIIATTSGATSATHTMKWPAAKVNRGDSGRAAQEIDYDVVRDLSRIHVRTPPRGMAQGFPNSPPTSVRSARTA